MDTDVQYVIQCQTGDNEAFGYLYSHYATSMLEVIEPLIQNPIIAQDILHDGFIIAFCAIRNLKNPARFEAWLTTIMRNLSLQYLRDAAKHISMPISDGSGETLSSDDDLPRPDLSWVELNRIIDKLPAGYNKVFRLSVLDGLSHKEIGALLGIAPHSVSSQLSRAKAMLRRLITKHYDSIGLICILAIITCIIITRSETDRRQETGDELHIIADKKSQNINAEAKPIEKDTIRASVKTISERAASAYVSDVEGKHQADSTIVVPENPETADTVIHFPVIPIDVDTKLTADITEPIKPGENKKTGWSISVEYSGNPGRTTDNSYRIPLAPFPDLPSGEPEMLDVTETRRHYAPATVGISLNRSLSGRWSVESGIRYTFLKSDFMKKSRLEITVINQGIHYIGIPFKFNYRILSNTRFSLYGQGGVALDIPVAGTHSIERWEQGWDKPTSVRLAISAPLQWSIEGGLGIQYHITPHLSIYAEPSFRYHFNSGTEIKTLWHDRPFVFTIPVGIRLSR